MMLAIFLYSAGQALDMPIGLLRLLINKSGHIVGYALLAVLYWRAFEFHPNKSWLAWLLALLYAMTDEFHQSFVPGRHPSLFDVLVYDNVGALLTLSLGRLYWRKKHPLISKPTVGDELLPANS